MSVIASKAAVAWSGRHGGRIGIITFDGQRQQRSSAGTRAA
jgi:hypothetical protein